MVKSCKVLLVDDDAEMAGVLASYLSRDFEVKKARNAEEGLSRFREHLPHLTLLDLELPDRGGVELLKDILECDPKAAVVILSGNASLALARETIKMGARDFVAKPFDLADLKETIRKNLPDRR